MIGDATASPLQGNSAKPGAAGGIGQARPTRKMTEPRREIDSHGVRPVSLPVRLTGEAISILAMALATLAIGVALHIHFGFAIWAAIAGAIFCYGGMLVAHALMPRHYLVEKVPPAGSIARAPGYQGAAPQTVVPQPTAAKVSSATPNLEQSQDRRPPNVTPSAAAPDLAKAQAPIPTARVTERAGSPDPFAAPAQPSTAPEHAVVKDRGRTDHRPEARDQVRVIASSAPTAAPPVAVSPTPRESDVEMIQGLIRKLADEVNAASGTPPQDVKAAAAVSERAISASLDALNATADSMRSQDGAAQQRRVCTSEVAGDDRRTESGRPPEVNARLSALAEALALGRVEVLLDPIVDFNAGAPRHFELYVRLRDEQGRILDTEQSREDFTGTGMLPRIDGARLAHASQIAVRFAGRGRDHTLFSTVSGETLSAHKFLQGVADAYRERRSVAGVLIMTFSQADVRGFASREWQALSEFSGIGFRYCIADVMDLDMDFEDLKSRGFDFVKLDAGVFLEGLPAGNDVFVPVKDVCKHLAGLGLSVIVGGMENAQTAAKVFGFGVLFGQGTLFGGAKAVKRELIAGSGDAAA